MRHLIAVLVCMALLVLALGCQESSGTRESRTQKSEFGQALTRIAERATVPDFHHPENGAKAKSVNVSTPAVRFRVDSGDVYATVQGRLFWGFWNWDTDGYWVQLAYDETYELTPEMVKHPEGFYWVIQN